MNMETQKREKKPLNSLVVDDVLLMSKAEVLGAKVIRARSFLEDRERYGLET
jgi:hypothetical protein